MYKPDSKHECLAHNIRLLCENNGYTHRDFAALIGMSDTTVQSWLALRSLPELTGQKALEKIFSASFDKICSTIMTVRLEMDHTATIEDIFPYNCIIAATNYCVSGIAVMAYYEDSDEEFDMSYRNITPAEFSSVFNNSLNYREQAVLELRYRDGLVLDDVGKRFGITRERVRQIEHKALRKINFGLKSILAEKPNIEELKRENVQLRQHIIELESSRSGKAAATPIQIVAPVLDTPIEELDLSVRTYNCLKRRCIDTLGDILNYDESIFRIRNMGKRSVEELISVIGRLRLGYKFDSKCQHFVKEEVV